MGAGAELRVGDGLGVGVGPGLWVGMVMGVRFGMGYVAGMGMWVGLGWAWDGDGGVDRSRQKVTTNIVLQNLGERWADAVGRLLTLSSLFDNYPVKSN